MARPIYSLKRMMLALSSIAIAAAFWGHSYRLGGHGSELEWLVSNAFGGAFAAGAVGALLGRFWWCLILGFVLSALGEYLWFWWLQ